MSHSSEEADKKKVDTSNRMWEGEEAKQKDSLASSQGYCGYCRLLYSNLDKHLSSLKHLESIQATARDPAPSTSTSSILLDRFLQDVLVYPPHSDQDHGLSHVELPPGSPLPLPWLEPGQDLDCPPRSQEAQQERLFSPDRQSFNACQQEEFKDLQLIPIFTETVSNNWDPVVQVELPTPSQMSQSYRQGLSCLMGLQVLLKDPVYKDHLYSALHLSDEGGKQDQAIPPELRLVPESFRGKSWAQIQQEDEEKVERLVHQFRRHTFTCYFDSESLARYGRRSQSQKRHIQKKETASSLYVQDEEDVVGVVRRKGKQSFRVASRCQVVKLSQTTQTVHLLHPEVRSANQEPTPFSANQEPGTAVTQRPTGEEVWDCLPSRYSPIMTPLQPQTSLLYLLAPASSQAPWRHPLTMPSGFAHLLAPSSASKRCRKKRRSLDLHGSKVKYKQFPVRFYDPNRHRVLNFPFSSGPAPSCRRQLFRSLSPDPNAYRLQVEGLQEVKGPKCTAIVQSTLSRDLKEASPAGQSRVAKDLPTRSHCCCHTLRLHPLAAKRSRKTETLPSQAPSRREGLRQTVSNGQGSTTPSLWGHVLMERSFRKFF